ncbi:MAG: hypothetical protein R2685_10045 [Candidatus Nitrosocosmicus sp.]|nr:hypothetical protein [Candidatus Nitrosocosmicus sp.]
MFTRNKTPSKYVYYGLRLYFSGLSLRKASERLSQLYKRNHVSIWNWIQNYPVRRISSKNVCCREVSVRSRKRLWKAPSIY